MTASSRDGTVAHRHIVVPAGALAAALRAGRLRTEVAGEDACAARLRSGSAPLRPIQYQRACGFMPSRDVTPHTDRGRRRSLPSSSQSRISFASRPPSTLVMAFTHLQTHRSVTSGRTADRVRAGSRPCRSRCPRWESVDGRHTMIGMAGLVGISHCVMTGYSRRALVRSVPASERRAPARCCDTLGVFRRFLSQAAPSATQDRRARR